jgi:hypothetical protein
MYGKAVALKTALQQQAYQQQMQPLELQRQQQELALQQQQVQDVQAGQTAYGEWDGKDYGNLAKLIIQHGGSLNAANQVAMYGLNQQKTLSEIVKNEGEAGKAKVDALKTNNDIAAGAVNALLDVPDAQLPQAVLDTAQRGAQQGWMDPQHMQIAQQLAQQSPERIRLALPNIVKSYQSASQQAEDALKLAQVPGVQAESQLKIAAQQAYGQWAAQPQNQGKNYNDYLTEQQASRAGAEAKARLPYEISLAAYNRQTAMGNTLAEHALNSVTGMFADPQHGYSQTLSQLSATKTAIANAQNGDQLAASLAPLMTALGVVSYAGIHRINQYDISAAGPGVGGVLRQIDARLSKLGSGKLASGTATEMSNLMDDLLDAKYSTVLQSAQVATANGGVDPSRVTVMGKNGNLVRLSDAVKNAAGGGGAQVTDPRGVVHTFPDQKSADAFKQAAGIR